MTSSPRTLYQKIWDDHVVRRLDDGTALIWIDRHLIHEVTTPQAFEALRLAGRRLRRPDLTLAVPDHNVPTTSRALPILDPMSKAQLEALARNCADFGVEMFAIDAPEQGIVHVIGPEQGFTLPGLTIVCGDSHTATHGAFGALAFGIGTSEVEHVFATQTLLLRQSRAMEVRVTGQARFLDLAQGCGAGDLPAARHRRRHRPCHRIYRRGHPRHVDGRPHDGLQHGDRGRRARRAGGAGREDLCLCARAGRGRRRAPIGTRRWPGGGRCRAMPGAVYDTVVEIDGSAIAPLVTWGTSPEDVVAIGDKVPAPGSFADEGKRAAAAKSLDYMGLTPGTPMEGLAVENIFIGSCTNSRIEDLRIAAAVAKGRKVAAGVKQALVVPGSGLVKRQAEAEGLDRIFIEAGFDWREPGCSMCLGMNPDQVPAGERCASTSNRNFVGRQGVGARTHLVSPAMAAAAAVTGRLTDVRELMG